MKVETVINALAGACYKEGHMVGALLSYSETSPIYAPVTRQIRRRRRQAVTFACWLRKRLEATP